MRWHVLAIGKPKLEFARAGFEDYSERLRPMTKSRIHFLKNSTREKESAELLRQSAGTFRIVLDERGEQVSSHEFAKKIETWEQRGIKEISLLIGGADGHTDALRAAADWLWALSKLTLQHELALVVLLEQLYRAGTIKSGSPYHRD